MSDDELKLNRRRFLRHAAIATTSASAVTIALKTDALTQLVLTPFGPKSGPMGDAGMYPYFE